MVKRHLKNKNIQFSWFFVQDVVASVYKKVSFNFQRTVNLIYLFIYKTYIVLLKTSLLLLAHYITKSFKNKQVS